MSPKYSLYTRKPAGFIKNTVTSTDRVFDPLALQPPGELLSSSSRAVSKKKAEHPTTTTTLSGLSDRALEQKAKEKRQRAGGRKPKIKWIRREKVGTPTPYINRWPKSLICPSSYRALLHCPFMHPRQCISTPVQQARLLCSISEWWERSRR